MPESTPVGSRVDTLDLLHSQSISEVAVATQTPRIEGSLADLQRSIGDVLYLSGDQEAIDEAVAMMGIAIMIPPLVNNVSTAVALGQIGLGMAAASGISPELLIAVALGALVDVLTPIGHHNNTVVMGLAGYRFGDFLKAGLPVTVVVTATATTSIWIWLS